MIVLALKDESANWQWWNVILKLKTVWLFFYHGNMGTVSLVMSLSLSEFPSPCYTGAILQPRLLTVGLIFNRLVKCTLKALYMHIALNCFAKQPLIWKNLTHGEDIQTSVTSWMYAIHQWNKSGTWKLILRDLFLVISKQHCSTTEMDKQLI